MRRRQYLYVPLLLLIAALSGDALADDACEAEYVGRHVALPEADAKFLSNVISFFKNKKRDEVLAILEKKPFLVRRYISGGVDSRGGNLETYFKPQQLDKNMVIRIPRMRQHEYLGSGWIQQPAQAEDFSDRFFNPETDGTAIVINRKVCDKVNTCDVLPFAGELENMLSGLLHCNSNKKAAYVFSDGLLITDMELIPWPIGSALFFTKHPDGYKLAALISFQ